MVANQQSINTVLSFAAKSVDPKILEQLLIGRDKNADHLLKIVKGIAKHGNNQQVLIVGQRGMGKTHLLRVLYSRAQEFMEKDQLIVAYFSEEEYGVASFFDFLIRILDAFIRWNSKDKDWLKTKMAELQEIQSAGQTAYAEKIIEEYIGKKPLIILTENFGDILNALKKAEQSKLRAWLYENKRVSIIATSQSLSNDFDREDRPFYGFFNIIYLKNLTFKDSLNFITCLAKIDGRDDVIKHLKHKGKSQVRAIHDLVKGNHRLLVTFYEFLKSDTLAKLSIHFIKTINDLKPYYETYIRYLPPQQQKIVRYIALKRTPQQGAGISKNCFIDQTSLSKQLSELVRKNLLEVIVDQQDKRNKLYDINEPLLRISIEVGEHKEGISALFIDFLALYYDENELTRKKIKFSGLLELCDDQGEKMQFLYEIQAIEKALSIKRSIVDPQLAIIEFERKVIDLHKKEGKESASVFLKKEKVNISPENYKNALATLHLLDGNFEEANSVYQELDEGFIKSLGLYTFWGCALHELLPVSPSVEMIDNVIDKFEKAVANGEKYELLYSIWGKTLNTIAEKEDNDEIYYESLKKFEKAIEINSKNVKNYIRIIHIQMTLSLSIEPNEFAKKAFDTLELAYHIDDLNLDLIGTWGGMLAFLQDDIEHPFNSYKHLLNAFIKVPEKKRITIWRFFARLPHFSFFTNVLSVLKEDLVNHTEALQSILIDWVNDILSREYNELNKEKLAVLRSVASEFKASIPELAITEMYINTFEDYMLNKNKNAVNELSKEQRAFFLEHIAHEKEDKS